MRHTYGPALLAFALATTAATARAQDTRALVRYVDSVATAAVTEHRTAGVSVAVVKNGRTVLAKGYGFADLENDVPATVETVYRIGSITKQFTSAAIMRLMEQGKLSLDDTLQKFLPNFPTQGNHVTVRHLLNHKSGIKSYKSLGPKWVRVVRLFLEQVLESLSAHGLGDHFGEHEVHTMRGREPSAAPDLVDVLELWNFLNGLVETGVEPFLGELADAEWGDQQQRCQHHHDDA
jgi:CubicO group peptidase (beta-lactamase class C family)